MKQLEGRVALITGASAGFGREMALRCAAAGAKVVVCARRATLLGELVEEISRGGGTALAQRCDATSEREIAEAVKAATESFGGVDILVNNAGMNVPSRRILDTRIEDWHAVMDANLTSAFLFTKSVLAQMIDRRSGTIIFVASRAANEPSLLAGAAYSSSKKALLALARVTNEEGNPHNVRASVINPGVGNTAIVDARPSPPPREVRQKMVQPEDVASAVVFIASLPSRVNVETLDLNPTSRSVS